jgi:endonuclease/exonuclease/phosphatase family metal-dependent hydrolase
MKKWILFCLAAFVLISWADKTDTTHTVMTYNIRLNTNSDGVNAWPKRKQKVFDLIKKYDPDILGMQEVLYLQLTDLKKALPGYSYAGVGRNDGKKKGEFSPIFFKKGRYTLLDQGTFWLSETPSVPGSKSWDAAITRICTYAHLKDNITGKDFYAFNTHFDHKGERARGESAMLIQTKMKEIAGDKVLCVMGDFNFVPTSEGYKRMVENSGLADSYLVQKVMHKGPQGTSSGFVVGSDKKLNRIDYVFTPPHTQLVSCGIIDDNDGTYYPSDHLPYITELDYTK